MLSLILVQVCSKSNITTIFIGGKKWWKNHTLFWIEKGRIKKAHIEFSSHDSRQMQIVFISLNGKKLAAFSNLLISSCTFSDDITSSNTFWNEYLRQESWFGIHGRWKAQEVAERRQLRLNLRKLQDVIFLLISHLSLGYPLQPQLFKQEICSLSITWQSWLFIEVISHIT